MQILIIRILIDYMIMVLLEIAHIMNKKTGMRERKLMQSYFELRKL